MNLAGELTPQEVGALWASMILEQGDTVTMFDVKKLITDARREAGTLTTTTEIDMSFLTRAHAHCISNIETSL